MLLMVLMTENNTGEKRILLAIGIIKFQDPVHVFLGGQAENIDGKQQHQRSQSGLTELELGMTTFLLGHQK